MKVGGWDPEKTGSSGTGVQASVNGAGDYGTHLANAAGFANDKAKSGMGDLAQSSQDQNAYDTAQVGKINKAGTDYSTAQQKTVNGEEADYAQNVGAYQTKLDQTKTDLTKQATDSSTAYTNTVQPNLQSVMKMYEGNANNAMTLKDAQDPNNAVATATRGMYGQQAQGIQNQGLADYGVLAGLGSQATAGQLGAMGAPVTGGQMAALQGANMGQASGAFAAAQNNANNLRLQGIQAGQNQSNWAYGAGQDSIANYMGATNNLNAANDNQSAIQRQYSQDKAGIDQTGYNMDQGEVQNNFGMDTGMNQLNYGIQTGGLQNEMAAKDKGFGAQQAFDTAQIQAANAAQAGKLGAIGTLTGGILGYAAGGGFGGAGGAAAAAGAAGGPAGAAAGAAGGGGGGGGGAMQSAATGAQMGQQFFAGFRQPQVAPNAQAVGGYQPGAYGGYGQSPYGGGQGYGQSPYGNYGRGG